MLLGLGANLTAPEGCTVTTDPDTGAPLVRCAEGNPPPTTAVVTPTQSCITDSTGKQVCGAPGAVLYTDPSTGKTTVVSQDLIPGLSNSTLLLIAAAGAFLLLARR